MAGKDYQEKLDEKRFEKTLMRMLKTPPKPRKKEERKSKKT